MARQKNIPRESPLEVCHRALLAGEIPEDENVPKRVAFPPCRVLRSGPPDVGLAPPMGGRAPSRYLERELRWLTLHGGSKRDIGPRPSPGDA